MVTTGIGTFHTGNASPIPAGAAASSASAIPAGGISNAAVVNPTCSNNCTAGNTTVTTPAPAASTGGGSNPQ
ncbi:hypothetical protein HZA85_02650 [Candidatus Uhrbacteria bacterium]|nr:hypothetical protein [Candidatus Uhrbacteria bacterium]